MIANSADYARVWWVVRVFWRGPVANEVIAASQGFSCGDIEYYIMHNQFLQRTLIPKIKTRRPEIAG